MEKEWLVKEEFDAGRDYGVPVRGAAAGRLSLLRGGARVSAGDLAGMAGTCRDTAYRTLDLGVRLGLLEEIPPEPSEFEVFCRRDTVAYFAGQLRGSKHKHEGTNAAGKSTRDTYLRKLCEFDRWLAGRRIAFERHVRSDADTIRVVTEEAELGGVEDLLGAYQESRGADPAFHKVIKTFLYDDIHAGKKPGTMSIYHSAITAYFERNDSPISLRFDPSTKYDGAEDGAIEMTLEDLMKMLTVGRPNLMEKAVMLSKFHRGLDNSTFADRFNFEAYPQIIKWFGTKDHARWDAAAKCPVPVKLTRIKTSYPHTGYLDVDAVDAIREWLAARERMTGAPLMAGEPMFIKTSRKGVTDVWISRLVRRLAAKAGLLERLADYKATVRYRLNSHEMRDLLKSTLIDSGCRTDVADHVIGHKPKDSYEKQNRLYPESMRSEYAKASSRINMFSNISRSMGGDREKEDLKRQVADLKTRLEEGESGKDAELREMRRDHARIMEFIARQEGRA